MRRLLLLLPATLVLAAPARAEGPVQLSFGYSFVKYLEEDAGSAPVGAFLAPFRAGTAWSLELDLGWQRDSEEFFDESITLDTFTAVAGPKFACATEGDVKPFVHVLGGARHDRAEGESNTSWGGFAGGGTDIKAGDRVSVRLAADLQMFFDEGENLKTLRLGVGLTY